MSNPRQDVRPRLQVVSQVGAEKVFGSRGMGAEPPLDQPPAPSRPANEAYLRHTDKCMQCSAVDYRGTQGLARVGNRCEVGRHLVRAASAEKRAQASGNWRKK